MDYTFIILTLFKPHLDIGKFIANRFHSLAILESEIILIYILLKISLFQTYLMINVYFNYIILSLFDEQNDQLIFIKKYYLKYGV